MDKKDYGKSLSIVKAWRASCSIWLSFGVINSLNVDDNGWPMIKKMEEMPKGWPGEMSGGFPEHEEGSEFVYSFK